MYQGPALGLFSSPNPFSETPAGTLKTADNVRFTSAGVIEPRRGFEDFKNFGTTPSRADSMVFYGEDILVWYDDSTVALYTPLTGNFVALVNAATAISTAKNGSNRLRMEGAARSIFFNSDQGILSFDGATFGPAPAPTPLNITGVTYPSSAGTPGTSGRWFDPNTAVAYRYTICKKDAFGRVIESAPSGRTTVINSITSTVGVSSVSRAFGTTVTVNTDTPHNLVTGDIVTLSPGEANFPAGAKTITYVNATRFTYLEVGANVTATVDSVWSITRSTNMRMKFFIFGINPPVVDTAFLRAYRSVETALSTDTPSDEMWLVYESPYLTITDIGNGYLDFVDTVPDDAIGTVIGAIPLYTNANTGAGALQANNPPPIAEDIVFWANRMWYANIASLSNITINMLGVGAPGGVQAGDTITVVLNVGAIATTFTAGVNFTVTTSGDPGYNIEQTCLSLIDAINTGSAGVLATYTSNEGGLPGVIRLEEWLYGSATVPGGFKLYGSRAESWTPQLPTLVTPLWPAPESVDDRHAAGLRYSRLGTPEAVPLTNYLPINSDNEPILRIFPLHYRLLIFKTDGIYTCTNVEPFSVQKLSAYKLLAPDSVCVLEDRVYALTDQGIITISDAGVVQISNCIDDTFNAMFGTDNITMLSEQAFGLAYRSERQVLLWMPQLDDAGALGDNNEQSYVFSTLANGFTRYGFGVRCAAINPNDNSLYYVATDENMVRREIKNINAFDYRDDIVPVVVASCSGSTITLTAASGAQAGDVIAQTITGTTTTVRFLITDVAGAVLTVDGTPIFTAGSADIYVAIETDVEFNKLTGATPADLKSVGRVSLLFRRNDMVTTTANFSSETQTVVESVDLENIGWGDFPWGEVPYGNPTQQIRRVEPIPPDIQQCAQLSVGFSTRQALAKFDFLGIDVVEREDTKAAGK